MNQIINTLRQTLSRQERPLNVIYVSSYIPRKCGIATYTKDVTNAINLLNSRSLAEILAINHTEEDLEYPWEAKFKINYEDRLSYASAAAYVNQSNADIVSLQHEFGLFGGECGEYILQFVDALEVPLVTTFHTVVTNYTGKQAEILRRIAQKSEAIIVMMEDVADRLIEHYGIPQEKIIVIPHGVPDIPFNSVAAHKKKRQMSNRLVLGNINLLDPNKGIEYALEAVAEIKKTIPEVLYVIIGQTHPEVVRQHGESYRNFLKKRVRELDIADNVRFVNEYLSLPELVDWLKTIDIYITPYLDPQQVTSGALAYAIGAGKACISTPYIYSKEMLAENRGILIPFRDSHAIAAAVIDLANHPEKKKEIESNAYGFGRLMTWPNVAQSQLNLFRTIVAQKTQPTEIP
ncbi:MAG TPA: glycosyltransferase family 4 protein [Candidatus Andersenbacteria bacterium]|nr:glycosyltransferase family 4 protein [Candidatus Andersenbacteria bacterium]